METIDLRTAAQILQVADRQTARRVLMREKVPLTRYLNRYLVSRAAVVDLAKRRGGKVRPGKPRKKNP